MAAFKFDLDSMFNPPELREPREEYVPPTYTELATEHFADGAQDTAKFIAKDGAYGKGSRGITPAQLVAASCMACLSPTDNSGQKWTRFSEAVRDKSLLS